MKAVEFCPRCGAAVHWGFGLAYGGYGPYQMCSECAWHQKEQEPTEARAAGLRGNDDGS